MTTLYEVPARFKELFNSRKRFNGQPARHWQREARKLVVEQLVRSSNVDGSIVGAMASARLLALAEAEDPELYQEVLDERVRCKQGLAAIMNFWSSDAR